MMMATCLRTLLWSFMLCFVVMTVWAMLMVEVVHPVLEDPTNDDKRAKQLSGLISESGHLRVPFSFFTLHV